MEQAEKHVVMHETQQRQADRARSAWLGLGKLGHRRKPKFADQSLQSKTPGQSLIFSMDETSVQALEGTLKIIQSSPLLSAGTTAIATQTASAGRHPTAPPPSHMDRGRLGALAKGRDSSGCGQKRLLTTFLKLVRRHKEGPATTALAYGQWR